MPNFPDLPNEVAGKIAAFGFDVYAPPVGNRNRTYLFFTDGTRIGYMQWGDCGGLSLSTVHLPNRESGTGFDAGEIPYEFTREQLEEAFAFAPGWSTRTMQKATRKYKDAADFLASRGNFPKLELIAKGEGK
jgi:hypothetical protein